MAAQLYLVQKANADSPSETVINDLHCMIINADDGSTDAVNIAEAVATAREAGHPIPDGYFDTIQQIGAPTGGIMDTNEDAIIILRRTTTEVIA